MTFIQVLNNPAARKLVDQIEDLSSSLDGKVDPLLEDMRAELMDKLYALTGFQYTLG